jgi:hypothetical protein
VTVADRPDDAGDGLIVSWELSPDDAVGAQPPKVLRYDVERSPAEGEPDFQPVGEVPYQQATFEDTQVERGKSYLYRVRAVGPDEVQSGFAAAEEPASPVMQLFDSTRAWFGILLLIVGGSVVVFIALAKRGVDLRVRKIAGLEAVDEAVGRATEMGRTVLFIPGIQDINYIETVAGITMLSRVAEVAADYDARIEVPTSRSLVMTTARETVASAFLAAGRPDAYREDDVYYLTDDQFGYVAGVAGTMMRERPAACFYMGAFYAESLILAETGNAVGAIQVAGTAQTAQLPFFVAACDYTLIGEEFFAASAYLSGEPHQLGSLKGQDLGKLIGAALIVIGCTLATWSAFTGLPALGAAFDFLKNNLLGDGGFLP